MPYKGGFGPGRPYNDAVEGGQKEALAPGDRPASALRSCSSELWWRQEGDFATHPCSSGDKAVIQLLLKTNIDVNDADADGNSALHWILASSILSHPQQISIILLLLEHGALVRQRNKMGLTAFHIAAGNGNSKALEILLLEDPLAVQYMTEMKETPLFFAVKNGSKDCTELLLTWGANSEVLNVRSVNQAFPNQHKCTALEVTDEDTTTERNVNSITKAEACKYFESHQGYVRGVQDGAYQSHSYAAKQLKRKIFVGGLPPSVDSDVLGKFFEEFGSVEDAVVIVTQIEKKIQSQGFGFVTFREEKSALEAMQANYVTMRGKKVEIKSLIPKLVFRAEFEKMSPQQREQDKNFQLPLQKSNEYIMEGDNPEQGSCADRLVLGQPAACSIEPQAHVTKSSEDPSTPTWLKVFKK
ncbi:putative nucleotide-binding alpha-beta plait domain, ankyrin repeat-containing [Rosa chinensis]|uniref:Putative nucleotide-binding alpha-beta plait domain, ankyrin repeat-containing n=1 Tax=Rosa chinensis TaxID=74649 RepID=A0A2P6PJH1_ROSCH|nr:putative nucleotide-binding alpha-beta plait domain, ankyrin repeat-containing [Rosa chinensis]